jgi:CubicO group peptidase (beta-lactamase class C family)
MYRFKFCLIFGWLYFGLLVSSCSQPTTISVDISEDVKSSIEKRIENEINPSIAIGIVDENGVRYYNFGKTRAEGKEVNEHTIYEIGSISKVFTGLLLA